VILKHLVLVISCIQIAIRKNLVYVPVESCCRHCSALHRCLILLVGALSAFVVYPAHLCLFSCNCYQIRNCAISFSCQSVDEDESVKPYVFAFFCAN